MYDDRATDDEVLAELLTSPDPEIREQGWRIVLWRFGLPLKRYIHALLHTRQMSSNQWEDIAQKTYSTAIELMARGKHSGTTLYPWLCRIAKNHVGNAYRREKAYSRHHVAWEFSESQTEGNVLPLGAEEMTEDIVLRHLNEQDQAQAYQHARSRLTPDERRLLDALMQSPNLSIQRLAEQLGENPKTVRNKKSLLLKKLKYLIDFSSTAGGDSDD